MATKRRQRGVRGVGSVHRDGDYWVAAATLEPGPDGKRRRLVRKSTVSPEDAVARLEAAKLGVSGRVDKNMTVAAWLQFWRDNLLTDRKPRTLKAYADCSRTYIEPYVGTVTLSEIGPEHITPMLNALEAKGLSAGTRSHARDVLSIALTKAELWKYLPQGNPTRLTSRPKTRPVRDEWTAAEANTILAVVAGDRLAPLVVVVLYLGLRPFEVLGLRWDAVDLAAGTLSVVESKTDAGVRTLPLPANVAAALRAHRARQAAEQLAAPFWHDPGWVFATPIGTDVRSRWLGNWWKALLVDAELPHRRLYSTRHTAATLMLNNGVPLEVVSQILGHSGLAVTADVYANVGHQLKKGAADVMDRVLG